MRLTRLRFIRRITNDMDDLEILQDEEITTTSETRPTITTGTIVRTVWLVLGIVNYILALFNISPIQLSNEFVTEAVDLAFLVIPAIWSWWKNNSFTKSACVGDQVMQCMKDIVRDDPEEVIIDIESRGLGNSSCNENEEEQSEQTEETEQSEEQNEQNEESLQE